MRLEPLRRVIEESDTRAGWAFDLFIQVLIVGSLIAAAVATLPDISDQTRRFLDITESVVILIFVTEYLLRLLVADRKFRFVFSFYGLIDLLAILPFFLTGADLRSVRAFRMLRLFRILKLVRYTAALRRVTLAISIAREELVLFGSVTLILLYLASVGMYFFEHDAQPEIFESVFHALWWAVITLTTVGYGDAVPVTTGGRIFATAFMLIGVGIVAAPAAILASAMTEAREIEQVEKTNARDGGS